MKIIKRISTRFSLHFASHNALGASEEALAAHTKRYANGNQTIYARFSHNNHQRRVSPLPNLLSRLGWESLKSVEFMNFAEGKLFSLSSRLAMGSNNCTMNYLDKQKNICWQSLRHKSERIRSNLPMSRTVLMTICRMFCEAKLISRLSSSLISIC